jgi:hypothetical protein
MIALVPDYFALWKSRMFLGMIDRVHHLSLIALVVMADIVTSFVV